MEYRNILFEVRDDVGLLTFNRPEVLNALNLDTLEELDHAIHRVEKEDAIRVLVLTGAGERAFVAGADISEFSRMTPLEAYLFAQRGQQVFSRLEDLSKPVIACVNGFALGGGCEVAMSCDFIYASSTARFGQPEIHLGLIPGFGGTQRLCRLVGRNKAKELCMTGERIDAREAKELGLVARVFPPEHLVEETMKVAKLLASRSQVALRSIKHLVGRGLDMDLRNACSLEAEAFALCFSSQDRKEGVEAFLGKRKPDFRGSLAR